MHSYKKAMRFVAQLSIQFTRERCICWGWAKAVNPSPGYRDENVNALWSIHSQCPTVNLSVWTIQTAMTILSLLGWRTCFGFHSFTHSQKLTEQTPDRQGRTPGAPEPKEQRVRQQAGYLDRGTGVRWAQVKDLAPVNGHTNAYHTEI